MSSIQSLLHVWSCNEWDPLKEIIIGTSIGANIPQNDLSHHATNYANLTPEEYANMPKGKYPLEVYEEAEEDLNSIVSILEQANITVYRPDTSVTDSLQAFLMDCGLLTNTKHIAHEIALL